MLVNAEKIQYKHVHRIDECDNMIIALHVTNFRNACVSTFLQRPITIKLIPIVESRVSDYIDINERVFSVGLGIFVYAISLFVLIIIGRSLGRVSYAGLGPIDKIFGLFFGIAKGYIFAVCIFSIVSWFYSYEKWDISLNDSYFFPKVEWGSMWLIDKFSDQRDFENTKEKIEEI